MKKTLVKKFLFLAIIIPFFATSCGKEINQNQVQNVQQSSGIKTWNLKPKIAIKKQIYDKINSRFEKNIIQNRINVNPLDIFVVDGDTVHIFLSQSRGKSVNERKKIDSKKYLKLRINGINTPESSKINESITDEEIKIGKQAAKFLQDLIKKAKTVQFTWNGAVSFERVIGRLYIDGVDYNFLVVEKGLAEVAFISKNEENERFYVNDPEYIDQLVSLQKKALSEKIGIWSGNPVIQNTFSRSKRRHIETNSYLWDVDSSDSFV